MISLRRPSTDTIRAFLASQAKLDFTYTAVGATGAEPPAGYVVDHTRIKLGRGRGGLHEGQGGPEALGAVPTWAGWRHGRPRRRSSRRGRGGHVPAIRRVVADACRIVYVVDEEGPICRFGFAYGTLPDHAGTGEERFLIEWDRASGEVWYDILAFSRPQWLVARLGYPYMRRLQKRFGRESAAAMVRAVNFPFSNPGSVRR